MFLTHISLGMINGLQNSSKGLYKTFKWPCDKLRYVAMCMGILNLAVAEKVGKSSGANLLLW